jgi:hypothetical protein
MYNQKHKSIQKKKLVFYVIVLLIPLIPLAGIYIGFTVYRTELIYDYVKSNQRRLGGKIHKADLELGFAPIPNSQGSDIFPIGPDIPTRYDANGFRVPLEDQQPASERHPLILTLGCSYTFGDATYAEDTYPYLVGQYLGGATKNGGVCSYGLAQMIMLGRRLVPTYKPDYLIVQYSPWLVSRATYPFAPSTFGKVPTPYFYKKDGLALHRPVFQTIIFDLSIDRYRASPTGRSDFISFLWNVGLPLCIHDDFNMVCYQLKKTFGFIPEPTNEEGEVIQSVYGELAKLAKENRAKLIIVVLKRFNEQVIIPYRLFPQDALVVDAYQALVAKLPIANYQNYMEQYAHWRGTPLILVDTHPNARAHRIIAEEIVSKIK